MQISSEDAAEQGLTTDPGKQISGNKHKAHPSRDGARQSETETDTGNTKTSHQCVFAMQIFLPRTHATDLHTVDVQVNTLKKHIHVQVNTSPTHSRALCVNLQLRF